MKLGPKHRRSCHIRVLILIAEGSVISKGGFRHSKHMPRRDSDRTHAGQSEYW